MTQEQRNKTIQTIIEAIAAKKIQSGFIQYIAIRMMVVEAGMNPDCSLLDMIDESVNEKLAS